MMTSLPLQPASTSRPGIFLEGISWPTYQLLVHKLESQPGHRLTYDEGFLEISMPLPIHEIHKRCLGRIVEIVT